MSPNLGAVFYLTIALLLVGGQTAAVRRPTTRGKVASANTPSSNLDSEESVKCVCDGGCEHLRGIDCPFGLTFDMCRCCLVCARGEREPCGGALGNCAVGQHCKYDPSVGGKNTTDPGEGRCSRKILKLSSFLRFGILDRKTPSKIARICFTYIREFGTNL